MESVPQLCDRCSQISFAALSCPTAVELRARKAIKSNRLFPRLLPFRDRYIQKTDLEAQKFTLGSLDQLRKSLVACHLCALIYDTIMTGGDLPVPEGDELIVRVNPDTCYHGYITDSRMDVEGNYEECYFILRRLSVMVELASNPNPVMGPLAYFDHIAQPCRVGAMSDDDFPFQLSPTSQNAMYFSGRKRPQVINLDWLRHWIRTCNTEHGDDCQLMKEQSQNFL
jgi:hypothetical protein